MTHRLVEMAYRMSAALGAQADTALFGLSDAEVGELLAASVVLQAQVQELASRAVDTGVSRGLPKAAGAANPTAWVKNLTRLDGAEASKIVRAAKTVGPVTEATRSAWARGEVCRATAMTIAENINTLPDWCRGHEDVAEKELLVLAGTFGADDMVEAASRVIERIDPDQAEEHLARQVEAEERRAWNIARVRFHDLPDGMVRMIADLSRLHADMARTLLEALGSPRRQAVVEGEPLPDHGQRLGRAFMELVEHLPEEVIPDAGGTPATVTVTITEEALHAKLATATLDTGAALSAEEARRIACNARLISFVMNGLSQVIDGSTAARLHSKLQRQALRQRDRGCVWPDCDRPPAWTEAHHLTFYADGGPTTVDNGALLCFVHHHTLHSDAGWEARLAPDNVVEIIPPARIDPQRRPRRNTRHHPERLRT